MKFFTQLLFIFLLFLSNADANLNEQYTKLLEQLKESKQTKNVKSHSLANGEIGSLYEKQKRFEDALDMTGRAILDAQSISDNHLLMKWEWQLARIHEKQNDRTRAISSYRRTIYYLELIRKDIPVTYKDGRSSFLQTLSPIYFGLANLLLKEASATSKDKDSNEQALLKEARDTIEKIKVSEMQDYFKSQCITGQTKEIGSLSDTTVVLYPIILENSLELLLSIGDKLVHKSVDVSTINLEISAKKLVKSLRPQSDGRLRKFEKQEAQKIYGWLIKPILSVLQKNKIDTIVFVPDGVLRLFPISSLYDGKKYLIESFAIATTPGLTLLNPQALEKKSMKTLLAGMSHPGPIVDELPEDMRQSIAVAPLGGSRGLRGLSIDTRGLKVTKSKKVIPKTKEEISEKIKKVLALPGVEEEIKSLSNILEGEVLMDDSFLLDKFSTDIGANPYQIIHIASHGFFGGKPDENFIMTYDHKLDMNKLSKILQPKRLSKHPIELLALSACQTAEGDDRSPLGLSGVALKSGARSVLGSLWPVSDAAAKKMLPIFYDSLMGDGVTKAKALQASQKEVLKNKEFEHPFYWSPFILIGNWL